MRAEPESKIDKRLASVHEHLDVGVIVRVTDELKAFAEQGTYHSCVNYPFWTSCIWNFNKAFPSLVTNETEKVTTRYVNMTTIATFFSSVTASTLQYSFQRTDTRMGGAVNLFWFVSLVFSVSSGVSSLLGMTWRRSSMWVYLTLLSHFPFQIWVLTDLDQESHLKSSECGWRRRLWIS